MKMMNLLMGSSILLFSCSKALQPSPDLAGSKNLQSSTLAQSATTLTSLSATWDLVFADEFNSSGSFDTSKWTYCPRQSPAWAKYLTSTTDYVAQNGTDLVLKMDNAVIAGDAVPYHSGGIQTSTKFSFLYGKVEVRAKFKQGQGSWPAIWMMPETPVAYGGWPNSGEIDIMEHVNYENSMHQTIHNASVTSASGGSSATKTTAYNTADYNIYGIIWSPSSIQFYVNNVLQYTYNRAAGATSSQWPFDKPFYLILNQSGGAGWPGAITNADLPFNMNVDYIRVYKEVPVLGNPGFEDAALAPWGNWNPAGNTAVVTTNFRSGTKAIRQQGGETSLEQVITGLSPNTTYVFGGYGKVSAAGESAMFGVKNYGGAAVNTAITATSYTNSSLTFTTGATNSSVTVYMYKPVAGTAYGDDFYFNKL
ncbi:family 16 glycosylhydrolase [Pedobacter sp. N36a]|uniref:family 16 glycosylhydrolase n=1 Tax=Pedobacter sp. N36a TaxID=2767996 RepID=UPI001656E7C5|nr:family 16 glycosylhydrolase [Pedobacter sp. N36a]MBC8988135.1 family 16 glycosylhydrolase [Pedobacter sp. N36a]